MPLQRILLLSLAGCIFQFLKAQQIDSAQVQKLTVGYLEVDQKNRTGAITAISQDDFNQGNINDPGLLVRNKVAGLGVYKKGSNPNQSPHLRLRGIASITRDNQPLLVIDGVIGATLDNVDPNDIETFTVLKSAAATAIYGMRGGSGVLLITTKRGNIDQKLSVTYRNFLAAATLTEALPSMGPSAFISAGGNDQGTETHWLDEVSRTGISHVHNLSASGGTENSSYRVSFNARDIDGILNHSGFDQINTRAYFSHRALKEKLSLDFNLALTNRRSDLSFPEAFRYATVFNPTAPVRFSNGNFWQAILFDNFNPAAILEQNVNEAKTRLLNYGLSAQYQLTNAWSIHANFAEQQANTLSGSFYPSTSFFRGLNSNGRASRNTTDASFTQFESYVFFSPELNSVKLSVAAGYSFQRSFQESLSISMGNLASDDQGFYGIDLSADQLLGFNFPSEIDSEASPVEEIGGFFGQVSATLVESVNLSLALRRDGATRLGSNQKWGTFYGLGANIDVLAFLPTLPMSELVLRVDHGTSGNLPFTYGLSSERFNYNFSNGGTVTLDHLANPDLRWETSTQTNLGLDFGLLEDRIQLNVDFFQRRSDDLIIRDFVNSSDFSAGQIYANAAAISSSGYEMAVSFDVLDRTDASWQTALVFSGYQAVLEQFPQEQSLRGFVGAPGQGSAQFIRLAVDDAIGQFWSPVYEGADENGLPVFRDVNGDGTINASFGSALTDETDFDVAGNAIPALEFGWSNLLTYKRVDANLFFRGAVGHTLVNTFRLFYEPIDPGAINSYNRVITDKAEDELTVSQLSSLYFERADFLRLDNLTIGYSFDVSGIEAFNKIRLFGTVENAFTLTNYTGTDPEPVMMDMGPSDNGGFISSNQADQLSLGIDRRNFYYTARTFLIGLEARF